MSAAPSHGRAEMLRRLRLGNLRRLFRDRCGPTLPDDDAGRGDLIELLLPISTGPNADTKMPNTIEVWAPWIKADDAGRIIDDINRTPIWRRMPTARQLGQRLHVTGGERERLKLWTIAAYDLDRTELLRLRREKARARMRMLRKLRGAKAQAASINRQKPWLAAGISRATWYRQRRETTSCAVRLNKAGNEPVSPDQAQPPQAVRAKQGLESNTPPKPEQSQTSMIITRLTARPPHEIGERTCLNGWWRNAKTPDEQLIPPSS